MLKQLSFLILPLISGYAFSSIWEGSAYHAARELGHRLYFRAFFYAVWLWVVAALVHIILIAEAHPFGLFYLMGMQWLDDAWLHKGVAPLDFSNPTTRHTVALVAFILGPLLAHGLNILHVPGILYSAWEWIASKMPSQVYGIGNVFQKMDCRFLYYVVHNNDFERLIMESFVENLPILFSMKNNKVYVGYVVKPPNPKNQRRNLRILPLLSGYRDEKDQQVHFTTSYSALIYEFLRQEYDMTYLEMILVTDEIVSMHLFDVGIYQSNFGGQLPQQSVIDIPE